MTQGSRLDFDSLQAVCTLQLLCIVILNQQILTEHSVKIRLFLFPFTIGT